MNSDTRACIAFVSYCVINKQSAASVYDYSTAKYCNFSYQEIGTEVIVYDYKRHVYVSGKLPNLYDYGNKAYITLIINGTNFEGYDYSSARHFTGRIKGHSIEIYDYEHGHYFNYSV